MRKLQQSVLPKKRNCPNSLDGFRAQHGINFLTDDTTLNEWSAGKVVKIPVLLDGMKPGWVQWRGRKRYEFDVPFFYAMIRDWVRGCTEAEASMPGMYKQSPMTKEAALDLSFEISPGEPA
jgi:hypothetical protein